MRSRLWLITGLAAVALLAAACGSSSSGAKSSAAPTSSPSSSASTSSATLMTAKTSLGMVLTNSQGFTLYWFAPDNSSTSKCTGSCASTWPPVIGMPHAASGVSLSGALGTITRQDGSTQATYAGHPLYRYALDTQPGMTAGNGVGGVWHVVTVTGGAAPAPSASSSSTGGGYY